MTVLIYTNATMAAKYLYDPYGNTLAQSGPLAEANAYRFSSKEWDANAGLYYYLYRFYDPNLQRWPNRDPFGDPGFGALIVSAVGDLFKDIGNENLFQFIDNEPLGGLDPFGLCNISIACHPVKAVLGLGTHCGVIAPDGTEYQGEPKHGLGGPIVPIHTPPNHPHSDTHYPVSCPCESCEDVQQKLQNYYVNGPTPPYNLFGPNSDTYAHNMLNAAGCSVDPIPTTIQRSPRQGGPISGPPTTTPPGTVGW